MGARVGTLRCRSLASPKKGNSADEYEDASAFDRGAGRFAIADGASESVFAKEWAGILCRSYVAESLDPARVLEWRQQMQKAWSASVLTGELPWYLEEKLQEGAFATFLGLTVVEGAWRAIAIGDSCLFHTRSDALLAAFPMDRADDFGTRPSLIGSRQRSIVAPMIAEGQFRPGDRIMLMTDALSEWFLQACEAGATPWLELARLDHDNFPRWIDEQRETLAIKNDDVTLLVLEMDE
jgi:hypothetical protein